MRKLALYDKTQAFAHAEQQAYKICMGRKVRKAV